MATSKENKVNRHTDNVDTDKICMIRFCTTPWVILLFIVHLTHNYFVLKIPFAHYVCFVYLNAFHNTFTMEIKTMTGSILFTMYRETKIHKQIICHEWQKRVKDWDYQSPCMDPECVWGGGGDRGSRPPLPVEKHKKIGFLAILFWTPWKITKLPSQHSMLGHHQPPAKCHLNGVSLVGW